MQEFVHHKRPTAVMKIGFIMLVALSVLGLARIFLPAHEHFNPKANILAFIIGAVYFGTLTYILWRKEKSARAQVSH